nr:hypothetical protein [Chitinophagaceae bacterium]
MLAVFTGVLGIGLMNFVVSFSLAFIMAVKSRGIHLSQYPRLIRTIGWYFLRHPKDFILPPVEKPEPVFKSLKKDN